MARRYKWTILAVPGLIPVSVALTDKECFYCPLDGMVVHRSYTLAFSSPGNGFYTYILALPVHLSHLVIPLGLEPRPLSPESTASPWSTLAEEIIGFYQLG